MSSPPPAPHFYNRPWHLDLDDRRHQGTRQWEREALELLLTLFSTLDFLYPPDFSDRDLITLRAAGLSTFATLRTDSPTALSLTLPSTRSTPANLSRKLAVPVYPQPHLRQVVLTLRTAAEVQSPAFQSFIRTTAVAFSTKPHP